jgi:hypothetical protein
LAASEEDIEQICFLLRKCACSNSPSSSEDETADSSIGIGSVRGIAAQAVIRMADNWIEKGNRHFNYKAEIEHGHQMSFYFPEWIVTLAEQDCTAATEVAELVVKKTVDADFIRSNDKFAPLLTLLFRHAEDVEESDNGVFLKRVIALQDILLEKGVEQIETLLQDAERP